ncbi:hypothetical protein GOV04_00885 [Candidatus Woesearchaeota archaeon]|nr:hypothetical protein [Candidatus Woesearchaeota archaeon]
MVLNTKCENPCVDALHYCESYAGVNADKTGLLFVLNRPDKRILQPSLLENDSWINILMRSQTGKILFELLDHSNLTLDDVILTNAFKCTLPGDREPKKHEYQNCVEVLEKQIEQIDPKKVILMGRLAYEALFKTNLNGQRFDTELVGSSTTYDGILTLITHHPGRIWRMPPEERLPHYERVKQFLEY